MLVENIYISPKYKQYLLNRGLISQYNNACFHIREGNYKNTDFKLRQPKSMGLYYFRINKQFRAIAEFRGKDLYILKIDNHQN